MFPKRTLPSESPGVLCKMILQDCSLEIMIQWVWDGTQAAPLKCKYSKVEITA